MVCQIEQSKKKLSSLMLIESTTELDCFNYKFNYSQQREQDISLAQENTCTQLRSNLKSKTKLSRAGRINGFSLLSIEPEVNWSSQNDDNDNEQESKQTSLLDRRANKSVANLHYYCNDLRKNLRRAHKCKRKRGKRRRKKTDKPKRSIIGLLCVKSKRKRRRKRRRRATGRRQLYCASKEASASTLRSCSTRRTPESTMQTDNIVIASGRCSSSSSTDSNALVVGCSSTTAANQSADAHLTEATTGSSRKRSNLICDSMQLSSTTAATTSTSSLSLASSTSGDAYRYKCECCACRRGVFQRRLRQRHTARTSCSCPSLDFGTTQTLSSSSSSGASLSTTSSSLSPSLSHTSTTTRSYTDSRDSSSDLCPNLITSSYSATPSTAATTTTTGSLSESSSVSCRSDCTCGATSDSGKRRDCDIVCGCSAAELSRRRTGKRRRRRQKQQRLRRRRRRKKRPHRKRLNSDNVCLGHRKRRRNNYLLRRTQTQRTGAIIEKERAPRDASELSRGRLNSEATAAREEPAISTSNKKQQASSLAAYDKDGDKVIVVAAEQTSGVSIECANCQTRLLIPAQRSTTMIVPTATTTQVIVASPERVVRRAKLIAAEPLLVDDATVTSEAPPKRPLDCVAARQRASSHLTNQSLEATTTRPVNSTSGTRPSPPNVPVLAYDNVRDGSSSSTPSGSESSSSLRDDISNDEGDNNERTNNHTTPTTNTTNLLNPMDLIWRTSGDMRTQSFTATSLSLGESSSLLAALASSARSRSLCTDERPELSSAAERAGSRSSGAKRSRQISLGASDHANADARSGRQPFQLARRAARRVSRITRDTLRRLRSGSQPSMADSEQNIQFGNESLSHLRANSQVQMIDKVERLKRMGLHKSTAEIFSGDQPHGSGPLVVPHQLDRYLSSSSGALSALPAQQPGATESSTSEEQKLPHYSLGGVYVGPGGVWSRRELDEQRPTRIADRKRVGAFTSANAPVAIKQLVGGASGAVSRLLQTTNKGAPIRQSSAQAPFLPPPPPPPPPKMTAEGRAESLSRPQQRRPQIRRTDPIVATATYDCSGKRHCNEAGDDFYSVDPNDDRDNRENDQDRNESNDCANNAQLAAAKTIGKTLADSAVVVVGGTGEVGFDASTLKTKKNTTKKSSRSSVASSKTRLSSTLLPLNADAGNLISEQRQQQQSPVEVAAATPRRKLFAASAKSTNVQLQKSCDKASSSLFESNKYLKSQVSRSQTKLQGRREVSEASETSARPTNYVPGEFASCTTDDNNNNDHEQDCNKHFDLASLSGGGAPGPRRSRYAVAETGSQRTHQQRATKLTGGDLVVVGPQLSKSSMELNECNQRVGATDRTSAEHLAAILNAVRHSSSTQELRAGDQSVARRGQLAAQNAVASPKDRPTDFDQWFKRSTSRRRRSKQETGNEISSALETSLPSAHQFATVGDSQMRLDFEPYGANLRNTCVHCQLIAELAQSPASAYLSQLVVNSASVALAASGSSAAEPNAATSAETIGNNDGDDDDNDAMHNSSNATVVKPSVVLTTCSNQSTLESENASAENLPEAAGSIRARNYCAASKNEDLTLDDNNKDIVVVVAAAAAKEASDETCSRTKRSTSTSNSSAASMSSSSSSSSESSESSSETETESSSTSSASSSAFLTSAHSSQDSSRLLPSAGDNASRRHKPSRRSKDNGQDDNDDRAKRRSRVEACQAKCHKSPAKTRQPLHQSRSASGLLEGSGAKCSGISCAKANASSKTEVSIIVVDDKNKSTTLVDCDATAVTSNRAPDRPEAREDDEPHSAPDVSACKRKRRRERHDERRRHNRHHGRQLGQLMMQPSGSSELVAASAKGTDQIANVVETKGRGCKLSQLSARKVAHDSYQLMADETPTDTTANGNNKRDDDDNLRLLAADTPVPCSPSPSSSSTALQSARPKERRPSEPEVASNSSAEELSTSSASASATACSTSIGSATSMASLSSMTTDVDVDVAETTAANESAKAAASPVGGERFRVHELTDRYAAAIGELGPAAAHSAVSHKLVDIGENWPKHERDRKALQLSSSATTAAAAAEATRAGISLESYVPAAAAEAARITGETGSIQRAGAGGRQADKATSLHNVEPQAPVRLETDASRTCASNPVFVLEKQCSNSSSISGETTAQQQQPQQPETAAETSNSSKPTTQSQLQLQLLPADTGGSCDGIDAFRAACATLEVPGANKQARSASLDTTYLLKVPGQYSNSSSRKGSSGGADDATSCGDASNLNGSTDELYPGKSRSRSVDISLPIKPGESYGISRSMDASSQLSISSSCGQTAISATSDVPQQIRDAIDQLGSGRKKFIQGEIKVSYAGGETRALKLFVNWEDNCVNGEHLWIYLGSSSEACYVGETECLKHGPRLCCSACKITAHTGCMGILIDKIKFICKHTFKDLSVTNARQTKEQDNVVYHHWVHKRTHCGRCKQCGKTIGNTKLPFSSKEIQAITCSWCKVSYHNKENCYTLSTLTEPCTLGTHRESIIPPTWILKLPPQPVKQVPTTPMTEDNPIGKFPFRILPNTLVQNNNTTEDNSDSEIDLGRQSFNSAIKSNSQLKYSATITTDTSGFLSNDGSNSNYQIQSNNNTNKVGVNQQDNTSYSSANNELKDETDEDVAGLHAADLSIINQAQGKAPKDRQISILESLNQSQKQTHRPNQLDYSQENAKRTNLSIDTTETVLMDSNQQRQDFANDRRAKENIYQSFKIVPQVVPGVPNAGAKPVLVFVNPRSGGNQGAKMMQKFNWLLNPRQVFDLIQSNGPRAALELYRGVPNLRILTIGGDGTASWILSTLDEVGLSNKIPVAVLPLGTGNDLAQALGWGSGYTDEPIAKILTQVRDSEITYLDRWNLNVERNHEVTPCSPNELSTSSGANMDFNSPSVTSSPSHHCVQSSGISQTVSTLSMLDQTNCDTSMIQSANSPLSAAVNATIDEAGCDQLPMDVINNYFSFGVDAHIALEFHNAREAHPERFNSRLRNKGFYVQAGGKDLLKRKWKDLSNFVTLYCDGQDMTSRLKELKVHSVLFLNIPRYGGGTRPWPTTATLFAKPRTDDGLIEVIGLTTYQLPLLQAGGHGTCIAQCRSAKIITSRTIPMQVDGEPCKLLPSIINISFRNRVCMLSKSKSSSKNVNVTNNHSRKVN